MSDIKLKHKIIRYLENKCNNSKISKKTLGIYIRAAHICAPVNIWLAMLYISKPLCIFFIIILFMVLFLFYIFDGCILTMLEKKLCDDTFTLIDPFLELNSLELNTKNRYNMTIKGVIICILIALTIFSYRFLI
jgi:hypothetical protein